MWKIAEMSIPCLLRCFEIKILAIGINRINFRDILSSDVLKIVYSEPLSNGHFGTNIHSSGSSPV